MWLVAGLGNPGVRYAATRHNIGFWVVEALGLRLGSVPWTERDDGLATVSSAPGCLLLKPLTYMNRSGQAVQRIAEERGIAPQKILAVVDDVNLDPHRLRIRPGGSDGGHNGLASIAAELADTGFPRLRVGVGRPEAHLADYVLSEWPPDDILAVRHTVDRAAQAVAVILAEGVGEAMNRFNAPPGDQFPAPQ